MQKSVLLALGLLTMALPTSAIVLTPAPALAQTRPARMKTYTIGAVSFQTPSGWIEKSEANNNLVLNNRQAPKKGGGWAPKGSIRVIAQILAKDLESASTQNQNSRGMGRATEKTEKLTIDGKPAIRLHEIYEDGFPAGITTFIATGENQTIKIITLYSDKPTEQQVKQIHRTIRIN